MRTKDEFATTIQLSYLLASDIGVLGDEATVIDAVHHAKEGVTEDNVQQVIEELFHVNIPSENLKRTISSLYKQNKLCKAGQCLVISPQTLEEITKVALENEKVESESIYQWLLDYENVIGENLSDKAKEDLESSILVFLRTFFLTHGADCYELISGQKQREYNDISTLADKAVVGKELKRENVVEFLATLFSRDLSEIQKLFLLALLKKAVHYLSMVAEHSTQEVIARQIAGVSIYLDTTILYRLFNLQGEERYRSIKQLVGYCKKANAEIKVFRTSVEELKRRIAYDSKVIMEHPIPVTFASIGYKCRTEENYISTFWKAKEETGVSAQDFNFRFKNVKLLLEEYELEIDETDYIAENNLNESVEILENKVSWFCRSDSSYSKSDNAITHDAKCLAMISHLQEKEANTVMEAKTFFLTTDWSLIRLQRLDSDYKNRIDMSVLPSQLMQLFCMTSPTTDYFEAFLGLFSSSKTSFGMNTLSNEQMQEILGRVAMYKGTTPTFAEKVLSNQLIQSTFSKQESEEEKKQLIDNAMISTAEGMEQEINLKEQKICEKEEMLKQSQESLQMADKQLHIKETDIERLSEEKEILTQQKNVLESRNQEMNIELQNTLKYKERYEAQMCRKAENIAMLRCASGVIMFGIGVILILISVMALIPVTSKVVQPIFLYVTKSILIEKIDLVIDVIAIFVALGLGAVSGGYFLYKPGYEGLRKKYLEQYIQELKKGW